MANPLNQQRGLQEVSSLGERRATDTLYRREGLGISARGRQNLEG